MVTLGMCAIWPLDSRRVGGGQNKRLSEKSPAGRVIAEKGREYAKAFAAKAIEQIQLSLQNPSSQLWTGRKKGKHTLIKIRSRRSNEEKIWVEKGLKGGLG